MATVSQEDLPNITCGRCSSNLPLRGYGARSRVMLNDQLWGGAGPLCPLLLPLGVGTPALC